MKVQDPSLNIVAHGNVKLKGVTDEHAPPHLALQDLHTLRFALKEEIHVLCDQLQNVAFPVSDSKNVFAYSFEGVYQEDGWKVYDAEKELQRMVRQRNSWGGDTRRKYCTMYIYAVVDFMHLGLLFQGVVDCSCITLTGCWFRRLFMAYYYCKPRFCSL